MNSLHKKIESTLSQEDLKQLSQDDIQKINDWCKEDNEAENIILALLRDDFNNLLNLSDFRSEYVGKYTDIEDYLYKVVYDNIGEEAFLSFFDFEGFYEVESTHYKWYENIEHNSVYIFVR